MVACAYYRPASRPLYSHTLDYHHHHCIKSKRDGGGQGGGVILDISSALSTVAGRSAGADAASTRGEGI